MTNNKKFEIRVRAVVEKDGKFLVCKHKDECKDYYFLAGGHVEFGETAKDAVIRELNEELIISIRKVSLIGGMEDIFTKEDGEKHHDINLFFYVEFDDIEDKSKEDEIDFIFLSKDKFLNEKVYPVILPKAIIKWKEDGKFFWLSKELSVALEG